MIHLCDICGQPATIHETVVDGAKLVERHFCKAHGEEMFLSVLPLPDPAAQPAAARELAEYWSSLSGAERARIAEIFRLNKLGI